MNVQIVDLTPEYIDGALDVFYESNLLHCSGAPDYFRKIPKEHSRPYLEWIIRNENTFGLVALADGKVAGRNRFCGKRRKTRHSVSLPKIL